MNKEALLEALKEGLRLALFASVSALLSFALEKLGLLDQNELSVMVGTMALRTLDKALHEWGKDLGKKGKTLVGGLSRF